MQRNGPWVAEPEGAREEQARVARQEEQGHVGAARGVQDQNGEKAHERGEPGGRTPLPWRNPHVRRNQQQDDNGKSGRVPDVLSMNAQEEFRGYGDDPRECMEPGLVCAQQKAQRESRDQRRARIKTRQLEPARAERLREQRGADGKGTVERLRPEIEPAETVDEQARERRDLIMPRVRPECSRGQIWHRHSTEFGRPMLAPRDAISA